MMNIFTSHIKKSWYYFFVFFVHGDVVIHNNVLPGVVLVYFNIVDAVLVEGLALEHFLKEEVVVFYGVEACGEQVASGILAWVDFYGLA